jgi:multidrug efflux pump subunit AcrB
MNLPNFSIQNYQFIFIVVILGLFIGLDSFLNMPRSEDPNPDFPNFNIVVIYPGTSPEDMEELVVDPIEEVIEELDDIDDVNTSIEDGVAVIRIQGIFGIDTDEKYDEIVAEVNAIRDLLPEDIFSLDINQFDPRKRTNIQQLAIVSDKASYAQLNDIAEDLSDRIKKIPGIYDAEIDAVREEEIRISLDFQEMASHHITLNQVIGVLSGYNANIPGGDIDAGARSFNIKTSGGYKNLEEIAQTVVGANNGRITYLRDIAEIGFNYEDLRWKAEYMGEKCVYVNLTQKKDINLIHLGRNVNELVDNYRETLPADVKILSAFEQAPAVKARIDNFFLNLLQGIVLVGAIIFLFLGFRPSLIIMTVIPVSILMAIGTLNFAGFALQQISIASLVIALGLLVDNGIVVIENIVRFRRKGLPWIKAAAQGTAEVGSAIISSTATTVLAFGPLILLESGPGEFVRSLPVTVVIVLIFSLILALTFTPILAGRFLKKQVKKKKFLGIIQTIIHKVYRPSLNFALAKSWVIILVATFVFVGAFALFPFVGVSFFPTADKPLLLIEVDAPKGSNLERTERAVSYVKKVLDTTDYVRDYVSNVGHGNPQVYYNRIAENYKKNHGQLLVNFKAWDQERFYYTLVDLREAFNQYPDARITFRELTNGPPFEAPIEIKILGENLDTLKRLSFELESIIRKTPGTLDVDNPLAINKTDLKVEINREKAGMIGLALNDVDLTVRTAMSGLTIDDVTYEDGEEYPLVVRMPFENKTTVNDFNRIYVSTRSGAQVPLKQVANIRFESGVNQILHYNYDRSTAVTANVNNPDNTAAITEAIIAELDKIEFPNGYSYYVAGEYETQQESFGDLGYLLIVAMVAIFAVLVLQFRSITQPLIVFSAIPLALTGSFVALFITGWSFSFLAFVGFISLVGIVVNNSIILVDYTNQLIREGKEKIAALKEACETRFTPILLTTMTTILGLLPLTAQGTSLWSPLGWTIIGGMISSTFLTLLVVPILYNYLTPGKK